MKRKFVAIDLFSGGGGLTIGLKNAGFTVSGAVELDTEAANTFTRNHSSTVLFNEDIRNITGEQLIRTSPTGKIDLIGGCPPCQGFSQLTAKHRRDDPRNQLVLEFSRLISEIRPLVFMLENVPGLELKGESLLGKLIRDAEEEGYEVSSQVLQVADYGVPQSRRRLVVLGSRIGELFPPDATHGSKKESGLNAWATVKQAIGKAGLGRPLTLEMAHRRGGPQKLKWHVVRKLSETNKERLRATKAGESRSELPISLRPQCHKGSNEGFSNVYGRMSWNKPSPTITGGCTTLSKGRFGHPSLLRTISVREAALLQTFPPDYEFATDYMETACTIIGNALPPVFAQALADRCYNHLLDYGH